MNPIVSSKQSAPSRFSQGLAVGILAAACAMGQTLLSACSSTSVAEKGAPQGQINVSKQGLALDGYDPVTYFSEDSAGPSKGKAEFSVNLRGVVYRFVDEDNRDRFLSDPESFEPAYGGWCAWGMTKNQKIEIDPESFLIEEGRLLLFYDGFFNDTRKAWLKNGGVQLLRVADKNWSAFLGANQKTSKAPKEQSGPSQVLGLGGNDPVSYSGKDGE